MSSNVLDVLTMLGSLVLIVLVLVLAYYATRWYAGRATRGAGMGKYIKVLEKTVLGTGTALVIVQIGQRFYLLGVGDKSVQLVSELPDFDQVLDADPPASPPSFSQIFRQLVDKTHKKDDGDGNGNAEK